MCIMKLRYILHAGPLVKQLSVEFPVDCLVLWSTVIASVCSGRNVLLSFINSCAAEIAAVLSLSRLAAHLWTHLTLHLLFFGHLGRIQSKSARQHRRVLTVLISAVWAAQKWNVFKLPKTSGVLTPSNERFCKQLYPL